MADFTNDISEAKSVDSYTDKLREPEFEAYDMVLDALLTDASRYEGELRKSLINTYTLKTAINKAESQKRIAKVYFHSEKEFDKGLSIVKTEIENLRDAKSDMEARETDEARKISFRLVEIYVGFFLGFLVAYINYVAVYLKTDPLQPNLLGWFFVLYALGCGLIYSAIGAIARVTVEKFEEEIPSEKET